MMTNKDKTGNKRQKKLRDSRSEWLAKNAYGLSPEGIVGALMRGDCTLVWFSPPTTLTSPSPSETPAN